MQSKIPIHYLSVDVLSNTPINCDLQKYSRFIMFGLRDKTTELFFS